MTEVSLNGAGGGGKGGGSSRTPVEDANTLRATNVVHIVDLISEGTIEGLVDGLKSVYFDSTPVENPDGSYNFGGVDVVFRPGSPEQSAIPGLSGVETEVPVDAEVTAVAAVTRSFTNPEADAVLVRVQVPSLMFQDPETGDIKGERVAFRIDTKPTSSSSWSLGTERVIQGKTTSPYQRTYRINLAPGTPSWDVRIVRLTPDSEEIHRNNELFWVSFTQVIEARLSYPDSALVAIRADARQFGNTVASRAYHVRGMRVLVPSNYDPANREYTGIWNGTFKREWTDNPAWVYYDVLRSVRYGAGQQHVDKWALYQIAQYCDGMVDDGYGGTEPRFTCNVVINTREDAIRVLGSLSSVFRGMTYWASDQVVAVADMPSDPVMHFSKANVIGEFEYSGTAMKARHSVVMVSWNDPQDFFRQTVEMVEDSEMLSRFGWNQKDITAFACSSRGQARRIGKWALYTEKHEVETLSFSAGSDAYKLRPGNIINVTDPTIAGDRLGGRVLVSGTNTLTLDGSPSNTQGTWHLEVMMPNGGTESRRVQGFNGNAVTLVSPLSQEPVSGAMWLLRSENIHPETFRVLSVAEGSEKLTFTITALRYFEGKHALVEDGQPLPERPTSLIPKGPVVAPYSLTAETYKYLAGGQEHQGLTVSWTPSDDPRVQYYVLESRSPNDTGWKQAYSGADVSHDFSDVSPGQWSFRVRGVTGLGAMSPWSALTTNIAGLLFPVPPDSVDISVGTFTITLRPRGAYPGQMYEFWRSNVALTLGQITSNAVRLTVSTDLTDTELSPGTTYFYYVRGVNAYGVSSWYPLQATTDTTPEKLLEALSGQIRESELDQALQERIDLIDGPDTLDGSVAQRIAEEAAGRAEAIAEEAAGRAEAIAAEAEQRAAEVDEVRGELIDGFEAEALARAQAIQQETDNRTVAITQLSEQVETEFDLLGLEINAIAAAYDATAASIYTMTQIRINDAEVVATQISQLSGKVDDNTALILDERQIRTDQYSSLATQVGILSAQLDARPSLNSGFEPEADYNAWSATSGHAISPVTSGVYSGLQSALVTSTTSSANPNSSGVRRIIAPETAAEFAGHEIRLAIYAKQPSSGAAAEFALAYQIAGQSVQWQRFTPGAEWAFYDVMIDVPAGTGGAQHAVAIWGSTAGGGLGVEVDRLLVTFAETDIPEVTAAIEQMQQALVDHQQAVAQELSGFEAQLNSNTAAIQQEVTTRATETGALASSVQTLQAQTQANAAAIVEEREAWTSETESLAEQILQQTARIEGGEAALEELQRVSAAEDEYLASVQRVLAAAEGVQSAAYQYTVETRVTQWEAQTVVNEQLVAQMADNTASITTESLVRASADEALGQRIDTVVATANGNTAAIQSEATTRANADNALGKRIDSVVATANGNTAAIQSEATTRANADNALGKRIDSVVATANGNTAAIQQEANTRASADSALSQQINTVQVQFAGDLASVQASTQAQYNENTQRMEAMWTLRIDNGGRVSGIGLADDGQESTFGIRADRFYIAHPTDNSEVMPMIVEGGQVLINDALINQLLFTKLRSADGSLVFQDGQLQAQYIAADQLSVNWAQIQDAWVTNAQIATASVDTLKIGDNAVTIPVSAAASSAINVPWGSEDREILWSSINAQGANVMVMVSFGVSSGTIDRFEIRRNGTTVIVRPGGSGAMSVAAHVGADSLQTSIFTVHCFGGGYTVTGRSIGLLATRR